MKKEKMCYILSDEQYKRCVSLQNTPILLANTAWKPPKKLLNEVRSDTGRVNVVDRILSKYSERCSRGKCEHPKCECGYCSRNFCVKINFNITTPRCK